MTGKDQPERQLRVYHYAPVDFADRLALGSVTSLRFLAETRSSGAVTATVPSFSKPWPRFQAWSAAPSRT
jgi:hypothetical protein